MQESASKKSKLGHGLIEAFISACLAILWAIAAVVLTGTDYNAPRENMTLEGVFSESRAKPGGMDLYDHLGIGSGDKEVLYKICGIFHIVYRFRLHFMLLRGNFDCFSESAPLI